METGHIDVAYVAKLARINLSEREIGTFQKQLGEVLGYVEKLQEVDLSQVEDDAYAPELIVNRLRADQDRPSLPPEQALQNAPAQSNELILTPKIVE